MHVYSIYLKIIISLIVIDSLAGVTAGRIDGVPVALVIGFANTSGNCNCVE
jgi:hypothetical protein